MNLDRLYRSIERISDAYDVPEWTETFAPRRESIPRESKTSIT